MESNFTFLYPGCQNVPAGIVPHCQMWLRILGVAGQNNKLLMERYWELQSKKREEPFQALREDKPSSGSNNQSLLLQYCPVRRRRGSDSPQTLVWLEELNIKGRWLIRCNSVLGEIILCWEKSLPRKA